jgi:hypothetical protein
LRMRLGFGLCLVKARLRDRALKKKRLVSRI